MGDENKIREIKHLVEKLYGILLDTSINNDQKGEALKINNEVNILYKDFMDSYLDFREISDNLYDGIYISDGEGKTLFVNNAYTRITGINKEEVIGRNVQDILKEGKLYKGAVTMRVIEQKKQVNSIGNILKNGNKVLVTGNPIFDDAGNVKLVVINNRDINKLISVERQLDKLIRNENKANEEIKLLRSKQFTNKKLVYKSKEMQSVMETVRTVALTDVTVLITGDSGTGKELIADEIYFNSRRNNKPFIKVNCAAIPEELLESELFGYDEGAFSGAKKSGKIGMFELANEGIILLDEIGDMALKLQAKILRVLQQQEIKRVGGTKQIKIDVRVIASTNKNLKELMKEGKFREDLFYRLYVVPIELKPLRERKSDIPVLIDEFLSKNNEKYNKNIRIEYEAMEMLVEYSWPGNIRELENIIERLVIITKEEQVKKNAIIVMLYLETTNIMDCLSDDDYNLKRAVQMIEKTIITSALKEFGSTRKAAQKLGIDQSTVVKKSKKLGIKSTSDDKSNQ
jgi:PAS domain S-box-containing protein